MKKHLQHLHPRRPLFWVLVVLAIALAVWGLWPHALAAQAPGSHPANAVVVLVEAHVRRHDGGIAGTAPAAGR